MKNLSKKLFTIVLAALFVATPLTLTFLASRTQPTQVEALTLQEQKHSEYTTINEITPDLMQEFEPVLNLNLLLIETAIEKIGEIMLSEGNYPDNKALAAEATKIVESILETEESFADISVVVTESENEFFITLNSNDEYITTSISVIDPTPTLLSSSPYRMMLMQSMMHDTRFLHINIDLDELNKMGKSIDFNIQTEDFGSIKDLRLFRADMRLIYSKIRNQFPTASEEDDENGWEWTRNFRTWVENTFNTLFMKMQELIIEAIATWGIDLDEIDENSILIDDATQNIFLFIPQPNFHLSISEIMVGEVDSGTLRRNTDINLPMSEFELLVTEARSHLTREAEETYRELANQSIKNIFEELATNLLIHLFEGKYAEDYTVTVVFQN